MIARKSGSLWPSSGAASACATRGAILLGPGAIRTRCGGSASSATARSVVALIRVATDAPIISKCKFRAHGTSPTKLSYGDPGGTAPADRAAMAAGCVGRGLRIRRRRVALPAVVRAAAEGDRWRKGGQRAVHRRARLFPGTLRRIDVQTLRGAIQRQAGRRQL